jgi:hypothetical protein
MDGRAKIALREKSMLRRAGVDVPDLPPEREGWRETLPAAAARSAEAWDMTWWAELAAEEPAAWELPACAWLLPGAESVEGVRMTLLRPLMDDEER